MKSRLSAARILGLHLVLACSHSILVQAHGEENGGNGGNVSETMQQDVGQRLPSYFSLTNDAGLVYTHIALMVIAWVVVLPVAVMLSIATSRYTFATQNFFTAINTAGIFTAMIYNARTPDLYPNNAHHKIGWIITAVISAHVVMGMIVHHKSIPVTFDKQGKQAHQQYFMPLVENPDSQSRVDKSEGCSSSDDCDRQNSFDCSGSLDNDSNITQVELDDDHLELPRSANRGNWRHARHQRRFLTTLDFLKDICGKLTLPSPRACLSYSYKGIHRIILPFGFLAFTTGIVTFGRFFEDSAVYNGLAHWIKGGVFFWLGLFNLGRWSGSFAELGWAWNIRPNKSHRSTVPSAEFVESFLIFFYGATNIFLEHLGNSDGAWSPQDLEHLAITVLFIGGGLCGMLVESTKIRNLLNAAVYVSNPAEADTSLQMKKLHKPLTYGFSLNPIPALVITLLGIMMGSHHQESMTSTMVHKQWGDLLLGASFARCVTYILVYLRPPTSVLPSRPPTELLASFGLIAGGIVLMASSKDTIKGMDQSGLDAMFLYTITMGLVGILMAWEVTVLAIKGLAVRKENFQAFQCEGF